jgi:hypothetical protein
MEDKKCCYAGCPNYKVGPYDFCSENCRSESAFWQTMASIRCCEGCKFCEEGHRNWKECCTLSRENVSLLGDGECQTRIPRWWRERL